jgi:hypothetical protein
LSFHTEKRFWLRKINCTVGKPKKKRKQAILWEISVLLRRLNYSRKIRAFTEIIKLFAEDLMISSY